MKNNCVVTSLYIIFLLVIPTLTWAQSPNFEWAKQFGGITNSSTNGNGEGQSIITDFNGNVYTAGNFSGGTIDFDPGPSLNNLTTLRYRTDIFIQKLDSSGNLLWVKQITGLSRKSVTSMVIDNNNNIILTGTFAGTADFDPGVGTFNLTYTGNRYWNNDIFVLKLDSQGDFIWAKSIGGLGQETCNSIAIDASGNIYTTGSFEGTVDFDPGAGTFNITSNRPDTIFTALSPDLFLHKLDSQGNFIWAKNIASSGYKSARITIDNSNIYVAGHYSDTIDFDLGPGVFNLTSNNSYNSFVVKLDLNANLVWAKQNIGAAQGNQNTSSATSITSDNQGNVILSGNFTGTIDFDPDSSVFNLTGGTENTGLFIQKLNSNGNLIWAKEMNATRTQNNARLGGSPLSIQTDLNGNIYTSGYYYSIIDFDPGVGVFNLTSSNLGLSGPDADIFIQKLDSNGHFLYAATLGNYESDVANSIIIDYSGNIYTTGHFEGTVDFNPGNGLFNLTSYGKGIFILKLSQMGFINKLQKVISSNRFRVYPNPTFGEVTIAINDIHKAGITQIQLYSISGKLLQTNTFQDSQLIKLETQLSSGIYLLHILDNAGNKSIKKIIKD